jgi:hypothetical protein
MTAEMTAMLNWTVPIAVVTAVVTFFIWFIVTLNRIQRNTQRTAEDVSRLVALAERSAPPLPPAPAFRQDMPAAEVLAAIEARGGRLRVVDGYFTGPQVELAHPLVIGELGVWLLRNHNLAIAQLLVTRDVSGR